jgi:hypothetical protein
MVAILLLVVQTGIGENRSIDEHHHIHQRHKEILHKPVTIDINKLLM